MYEKFLEILGHKIQLNGFTGYSGGLDTKNGKTGEFTYYSNWKDFEVVFHCATMLPFVEGDDQQIDRKRHIGNGIFGDNNRHYQYYIFGRRYAIRPTQYKNPIHSCLYGGQV